MKLFEDAFILVHIRISGCKIFGLDSRTFLTGSAVFFILANTIQMYLATIGETISWSSFVEAAIFTILTIYGTLIWLISWPKANRMLNKASGRSEEHTSELQSQFHLV